MNSNQVEGKLKDIGGKIQEEAGKWSIARNSRQKA